MCADSITRHTDSQSSGKAVDIKGNMYTLMCIVLGTDDLEQIGKDLAARISQAPALFKNTPVIVDFANISVAKSFDFNALFKIVRKQKLLPVAVRGVGDELREPLQNAGVPIVEQAASNQSNKNDDYEKTLQQRSEQNRSVLIDEPLQPGQQCIAETGDLILTSTSHEKAELIADGNIHVYGTLRGRALCGVHGDKSARIFCTALEASLVSVAGHYKVLDGIPSALKDRPVQISLRDDRLVIKTF